MSEVQQISSTMIENFLITRGIKYFEIPNTGIYTISIDNVSNRIECNLTVWLTILPSKIPRYNIIIYCDRLFSMEYKDQILDICNQWNIDYKTPVAYFEKEEDKNSGQVILEQKIKVGEGIHQELLDEISLDIMACGVQFWEEYFFSRLLD